MPTLHNLLRKKKTKDHDSHEPSSPVDRSVPVTSAAPHKGSFSSPSPATVPSNNTDKVGDTMMGNHGLPPPASAGRTGDVAPTSRPATGDPAQIPSHDGPTTPHVTGGANGAGAAGAVVPINHQATAARNTKGKYQLQDFTLKRTLGTGSFGRVHLVQSNHNQRFYAIKVLKKAQVVKMKQVEHTNDERKMLCKVKHAFLVTLWGTFQDAWNLYMVMDFVEGGELFSLLRKSQVSWPISLPISPHL